MNLMCVEGFVSKKIGLKAWEHPPQ